MVGNEGSYPLYDVEVQAVDDIKFQEMLTPSEKQNKEISLEKLQKARSIYQVGNLAPSTARPLAEWLLPERDRHAYTFNIIARNGYVVTELRLYRVKGHWKSAKKTIKPGPSQKEDIVLMEKVDADFPRDINGKVQWENP